MRMLFFTTCLTLLAIIIRGTLPRYRIDHVITLHWKFIALFLLLFFLQAALVFYIFSL